MPVLWNRLWLREAIRFFYKSDQLSHELVRRDAITCFWLFATVVVFVLDAVLPFLF